MRSIVLLTMLAATLMAATASAQTASTSIEGFRGARFGMTEAQVRAAVRADFKVTDAAIKTATHQIEQTQNLSLTVKDLVAQGGDAQIAWVLGFKSKALMQINLLWVAGDAAGAENIVGVANALRDYFVSETTRFRKDSVKTNVTLPDGRVVVFAGRDEKGRAVELVLALTRTAAQPATQPPVAASVAAHLRLMYMLAPENPDIQRIQPGQF